MKAAMMAIDAINANRSILAHFELRLKSANGQCSSDMVLKSFIDYIRIAEFNRMAGILGAC